PRDYDHLLKTASTLDLFIERAWVIRDLIIQGGDGLDMLLSEVDSQNREFERSSRFFRHGPPQPTRYLLHNQLTRLAFEEWGPPVSMHEIAWTNFKITEELLSRNMDSLRSVEFSLRLKTQLWGDFEHIYLKTSQNIAAMRNLTSLVLKGPSVELSVSTLFKLLVNCPAQTEVLMVEHIIQPMTPYSWNHLRQWDLGPTLWGLTTIPLPENACNWNALTCNCRIHLSEIWSQTLPTRIRILALPSISNTEQARPILIPFLKYRCPRLESLKIKTLGTLPLATLGSTLNADAFPDLRHLELDGIRKTPGRDLPSMFPVYDLALNACTALESLTISADSDLVEEVPVLVELVLKKHARSLKAVRWLGFGGKVHERLDLQWFLNACPSLERVEITGDHRFCSSGQGAVGSVIIGDGALLAHSNRRSILHDPASKSSPSPLPSLTSPPTLLPSLPNLSGALSQLGLRTPPLLSGSSWACTSTLTYLEISFRASPNIRNEYRYKIQIETFYKRLGQLTALVELHIGCECRCRGLQLRTCPHTDCTGSAALLGNDTSLPTSPLEPTTIFDMSLATGLGHMAGLGKLQVLNISRIHGHNMQEPELEWMKTHWPDLRRLQGIKKQHLIDWLKKYWSLLDVIWCNCTHERMKQEWRVIRPVLKKEQ
ncbi:hypothetical protein BGX24_008727, partial [Mortierella sp. AD032]